jgi:hypothetical protein
MRASPAPRTSPAWILCAGLALLSLGLVTESQGNQDDEEDKFPTLPYSQAYGTADSNDRMIAVTGVDVTGGSILYLVDTVGRQISVYQAQGGSGATANIKWVGARRIDLDLQVDGFNDKSELTFKALAAEFAKKGSGATTEK